jgi:hypothetical protein
MPVSDGKLPLAVLRRFADGSVSQSEIMRWRAFISTRCTELKPSRADVIPINRQQKRDAQAYVQITASLSAREGLRSRRSQSVEYFRVRRTPQDFVRQRHRGNRCQLACPECPALLTIKEARKRSAIIRTARHSLTQQLRLSGATKFCMLLLSGRLFRFGSIGSVLLLSPEIDSALRAIPLPLVNRKIPSQALKRLLVRTVVLPVAEIRDEILPDLAS